MNFFKLKHNDKEVFFRTDEILTTTNVVKDYATKNKLISADEENGEVYSVPSSKYCQYLLKKVYDAFGDELENIKQSWIRKTPDEICSMCYTAVYISDVMNAIDNADAENFDFEALERRLENPKKMIKTTCDYIVGLNSSDYNEAICDFINKGQER